MEEGGALTVYCSDRGERGENRVGIGREGVSSLADNRAPRCEYVQFAELMVDPEIHRTPTWQ